ncbi:MAG: hypothetical protein ABL962_01515 [Fimbriimonadaceae bacterium]
MRTTIDLTPDAHRLAKAVAQKCDMTLGQMLSKVVLERFGPERIVEPEYTDLGILAIRVGRPVTADEIRALDDEW